MKKITALISIALVYLLVAIPASAQSINPCPKNAGGGLRSLCDFDGGTLTQLIRNGITLLFIVAAIAALFFFVAGGIKWITSGGDKGNVEQARNWILASVIGLIITLSSYLILNLILNFFGLDSLTTLTIPTL